MVAAGRQSASTQLRRGVLEYCVMAALRDGERYGYELVSALGEVLSSEGTIYPLLSRLRKDGWVQTSWRESASGPPRRYYALTDAGRTVLERFRGEWVRFRDAVDQNLDTRERA